MHNTDKLGHIYHQLIGETYILRHILVFSSVNLLNSKENVRLRFPPLTNEKRIGGGGKTGEAAHHVLPSSQQHDLLLIIHYHTLRSNTRRQLREVRREKQQEEEKEGKGR